jgi:hypothetical protein
MALIAKKSLPFYKNWKILLPSLLVIFAAVVLVLELTNTTHLFHKAPAIVEPTLPTASQETKGETTTDSTAHKSSSTTTSTEPGDNKSTPATSTALIAPFGNFASNHHASLGANQNESSTCTTSSSAICQISFIKDGITKSLSAQATDRAGTAYWTWTPQDVGLTTGIWTIRATATLNGQTKTADDALNLELSK